MTFPIEITIQGIKINLHFFFETIAFIIGFRYYLYLKRNYNDPISSSNRVWILIGASFGAFFFSRLIGALEQPVTWYHSENWFLYFFTNKTIVGGLLGGLIGVETIKKGIGEKSSSGDIMVFPLILAMIIGRIGCFSSGIYEETYGLETTFFAGMDLGDGLLRHPVTLYEMVYLSLLGVVIWSVKHKIQFKNGVLFQFFMIGYFTFRFLLDFIKPRFVWFYEIGTIQVACMLVLLYYSNTIYSIFFKSKKLLV